MTTRETIEDGIWAEWGRIGGYDIGPVRRLCARLFLLGIWLAFATRLQLVAALAFAALGSLGRSSGEPGLERISLVLAAGLTLMACVSWATRMVIESHTH